MGICKFCGQAIMDTVTDEEATNECHCYEAEQRRKLMSAAKEAKEKIKDLFGEGCEARGLVALNADIIKALCSVVDLMCCGELSKVSLALPGICTIKMAVSGTQIKIERIEGRKYTQVAGEQ